MLNSTTHYVRKYKKGTISKMTSILGCSNLKDKVLYFLSGWMYWSLVEYIIFEKLVILVKLYLL